MRFFNVTSFAIIFSQIWSAVARTGYINNRSPETWLVSVTIDDGDMAITSVAESVDNTWTLLPGQLMEIEYPEYWGDGQFKLTDKNGRFSEHHWTSQNNIQKLMGILVGNGECTQEMNLNDPDDGDIMIFGSFYQFPIVLYT